MIPQWLTNKWGAKKRGKGKQKEKVAEQEGPCEPQGTQRQHGSLSYLFSEHLTISISHSV